MATWPGVTTEPYTPKQTCRCRAIARRIAGSRRPVSGSTLTSTHRWSRLSTRIRRPPIRRPCPTQASSGNAAPPAASTTRLVRNLAGSSSATTSPRSPATDWGLSSDSGNVSNTPRLHLSTGTLVPSSAARAGSATSRTAPDGVRTTIGDASGRSGSISRGWYRHIVGRCRMVSHGKPLRVIPSRMNAQRRSPASPCQDTSTESSASAPIDLTGYRNSPATRPTTSPTSCLLHGRRPSSRGVPEPSVADQGPSQRLSARPAQNRNGARRCQPGICSRAPRQPALSCGGLPCGCYLEVFRWSDQGAVGGAVELLQAAGQLACQVCLRGRIEPVEDRFGGADVGAVELDPAGGRGPAQVGGQHLRVQVGDAGAE